MQLKTNDAMKKKIFKLDRCALKIFFLCSFIATQIMPNYSLKILAKFIFLPNKTQTKICEYAFASKKWHLMKSL